MNGFERDAHEEAIWRALRERSVPLKFAYAGAAAYTHDALALSSGYHAVAGQSSLEIQPLQAYSTRGSVPREICEIGPGNGVHTTAFLLELQRAKLGLDRYLGLDFSSRLLELGMTRVKLSSPDVEFTTETWDIEEGPTRKIQVWRGSKPILVLLLGHTIGNPSRPMDVMQNIRRSVQAGDLLQIGAALAGTQSPEEIVAPYETDVFRSAAMKPLLMSGLSSDDGVFSVSYDPTSRTVIGEFEIVRDAVLSYRTETIEFFTGEKIRCFRSRRFQLEEAEDLFSLADWQLLDRTIDHDQSHIVMLGRAI